MKKQKLIFISIIIVCLAITGCDIMSQTVTENLYNEQKNNEQIEDIEGSKEINYIEYENKKYNFKIEIPSSWTFQEETNGFNIEIKTPKNDNINENLGVIVQELQTEETLESYAENTIKGLNDLYESYNEISKEDTEINGIKGIALTYKLSKNGFEIKAQQTVFLKENKAYVFQYTATKDTFSNYINEINYIINSFTILN